MGFFKTADPERELLEEHFFSLGFREKALSLRVEKALEEVRAGRPLAYITGEQAFFDRVFRVNESVLIPRPDTERLVERAIALLPPGGRFADLGTGSGCIAVSLLGRRPDASGVALDISPDALAVARENAEAAGVLDRLTLLCGDMLADPLGEALYDLILSNPPYIPREEIARYPTLAYEPQSALDGGEDGLDFYRAILDCCRKNLSPGGIFLFEIGFDQKEAVTALAKAHRLSCLVYRDFGGNDRVAEIFPDGERGAADGKAVREEDEWEGQRGKRA